MIIPPGLGLLLSFVGVIAVLAVITEIVYAAVDRLEDWYFGTRKKRRDRNS